METMRGRSKLQKRGERQKQQEEEKEKDVHGAKAEEVLEALLSATLVG